jgi:hypothetical protein
MLTITLYSLLDLRQKIIIINKIALACVQMRGPIFEKGRNEAYDIRKFDAGLLNCECNSSFVFALILNT